MTLRHTPLSMQYWEKRLNRMLNFLLKRNDFMSNNSNTVGTGTAIILTVLILIFIGWIISLFEPKCAMSGCKNEVAEGSNYCYLHDMSYRYYGNPDYNAVYEKSKEKQKAAGSSNSSYSNSSASSNSSSSSSNNSGSSSKTYSNKSSSKKSSSSDYSSDGYDDGYDDVYSDGEPDWDRYDEDDDYARGADDAMDEYEEYGEDW